MSNDLMILFNSFIILEIALAELYKILQNFLLNFILLHGILYCLFLKNLPYCPIVFSG